MIKIKFYLYQKLNSIFIKNQIYLYQKLKNEILSLSKIYLIFAINY